MDVEQIKELIKALEKSKVGEITVEEGGVKVCVRKSSNGSVTASYGSVEVSGEASVQASEEVTPPQTEGQKQYPAHFKQIEAPMVGTFYHASAPDVDPFVDVGQEVEIGQTVCILEAMKLMNEIEAEEKGIIKEILVENGQPVEYGQPLFLYEPVKDN